MLVCFNRCYLHRWLCQFPSHQRWSPPCQHHRSHPHHRSVNHRHHHSHDHHHSHHHHSHHHRSPHHHHSHHHHHHHSHRRLRHCHSLLPSPVMTTVASAAVPGPVGLSRIIGGKTNCIQC